MRKAAPTIVTVVSNPALRPTSVPSGLLERGLTLRLRETEGRPAQARVRLRGGIAAARLTDLLEDRDGAALTLQDEEVLVDLPPFPSSAMDGFAVRAADVPGTLPVVARIPAGRPAERPLAAGEAMAISTGVTLGPTACIPMKRGIGFGWS